MSAMNCGTLTALSVSPVDIDFNVCNMKGVGLANVSSNGVCPVLECGMFLA